MVSFIADENLNNRIIRGLLIRNPEIDIVRIQDVGLSGAEDLIILDWAASQKRILLTHDEKTIPHFAYQNLKENLPVPSILIVRQGIPIGSVI